MQNTMENGTSSDSSDKDSVSSDDSDTTDEAASIRKKRSSPSWCSEKAQTATKVTWPPPSTSNWRQLRQVRMGNPLYGTKMQLYSKTRQFLGVYPDGKVRGTQDDSDIHTFLELISAHYPGHVRIKGLLTHLYVAMDNKGRLFAEADSMNDATVFVESFQGSYNSYMSLKYAHLGWYIGLKKSGKVRKGPLTKYGQKAIQFLPRRSRFE